MIVLDSSALLALARQETGSSIVAQSLSNAHISALNASEFIQKLNQYGDDGLKAFEKLEEIGLQIHDLNRDDAYEIALLYGFTKSQGLSLADRACLSLAKKLGAEVYTADQAWLVLQDNLKLKITSIR